MHRSTRLMPDVELCTVAQAVAYGRSHRSRFAASWDRPGLEAMMASACQEFFDATGVRFPYNWGMEAPFYGNGYRKQGRIYHDLHVVERAARAAGWLRTIATAPHRYQELVRVMRKTISISGCGSPHHTFLFWKVCDLRSPMGAEKFLRKVRRRVNTILAGYSLRVAAKDLAMVLASKEHRVGKAALRAASLTVIDKAVYHDLHGRHNTDPRSVLEAHRGWAAFAALPRSKQVAASDLIYYQAMTLRDAVTVTASMVEDNTDGVIGWIYPAPVAVRGRCKVFAMYTADGCRQLLVRRGRQSYHTGNWYGHTTGDFGCAIDKAIVAWAKQAKAIKMAKGSYAALLDHRRTALVFDYDSYEAGNCRQGTANFATSHGIRGWCAPATKLMQFADDSRVARVLAVANERLSQESV